MPSQALQTTVCCVGVSTQQRNSARTACAHIFMLRNSFQKIFQSYRILAASIANPSCILFVFVHKRYQSTLATWVFPVHVARVGNLRVFKPHAPFSGTTNSVLPLFRIFWAIFCFIKVLNTSMHIAQLFSISNRYVTIILLRNSRDRLGLSIINDHDDERRFNTAYPARLERS